MGSCVQSGQVVGMVGLRAPVEVAREQFSLGVVQLQLDESAPWESDCAVDAQLQPETCRSAKTRKSTAEIRRSVGSGRHLRLVL